MRGRVDLGYVVASADVMEISSNWKGKELNLRCGYEFEFSRVEARDRSCTSEERAKHTSHRRPQTQKSSFSTYIQINIRYAH